MPPAPLIQEFNVHSPHIRLLFAQKRPIGDWNFSNLRAPYWRLYHLSGPGAWIQTDKTKIHLQPNQLYLIPPDIPFASGSSKALTQFFVHFVIVPQVSARRIEKPMYAITITPSLEEALHQVHHCTTPTKQSLFLLALVQQCLGYANLNLRDRTASTRVEQAQTLMRENLQAGISNPELAKALGMTPNAFIRWFKQAVGIPPQSWLNRERVHEASYWLHHNDASIDRIAESVGFCDRFHFSRVFKQIQGVSPAAFRKNRELPEAQLKV